MLFCTGNLRTTDRDGPYNFTLLSTQVAEVKSKYATVTGSITCCRFCPCHSSLLFFPLNFNTYNLQAEYLLEAITLTRTLSTSLAMLNAWKANLTPSAPLALDSLVSTVTHYCLGSLYFSSSSVHQSTQPGPYLCMPVDVITPAIIEGMLHHCWTSVLALFTQMLQMSSNVIGHTTSMHA